MSVFARRYESLCNTLREEFSIVPCESERESEDEPDTTTDVGILPDAREQSHHETDKTMEIDSRVVKCAGACKQCIACCYKVLHRYSFHASAFTNLDLAYQYLITLSFSRVSCERAFSKLKIKTRSEMTI